MFGTGHGTSTGTGSTSTGAVDGAGTGQNGHKNSQEGFNVHFVNVELLIDRTVYKKKEADMKIYVCIPDFVYFEECSTLECSPNILHIYTLLYSCIVSVFQSSSCIVYALYSALLYVDQLEPQLSLKTQ